MKKLYYLLATVLCLQLVAPAVHAEAPPEVPHILIVELQTGGASDATEEFVELYNPGDNTIDTTGWLLQYRAASGTAAQSWPNSSTKATIACSTGSAQDCRVMILPHSRLVLVHTLANIADALTMSGGFSGTGGEIRLVQPGSTPVVHDFVGYGTAADAETTAAAAPASGTSLKRVLTADGSPIDTQNNANDFVADCGSPTPGQADTNTIPYATGCTTSPTEQPAQTTDPTQSSDNDTQTQPTDATTETNTEEPGKGAALSYLPILITEVFPDPASPQQDSADEFIELYNPNDTAVTLSNYRLQTGTDYRYSYTLGDTPLGPHAYLAVVSAVSKLSLANSGSGVRLLDPTGAVAAEAPSYGDAKEGQSWIQDDAGWHWTLTPTPNAANTLTLPTPKVVAAPAPKKTVSTKASAIPKVTTPKVAAVKAPAAKKTTSPASTAGSAPVPQSPAIQYWLLIPLSLLAVGYVIYEYRENIARAGRKLWQNTFGKKKPIVEET